MVLQYLTSIYSNVTQKSIHSIIKIARNYDYGGGGGGGGRGVSH